MRFLRNAVVTGSAFVWLAGCAAILGIEPTDVIENGDGAVGSNDGNGPGSDGGPGSDDGPGGSGDGAPTGDGAPGSTPAFAVDCASSLVAIDPNGDEASAIVADNGGLFWATPYDSSVGQVWSRIGGVQSLIAGNNPADISKSEPSIVGLALDSGDLYWTSRDTYAGAGPSHLKQWSRTSHVIVEADLTSAGTGVSEVTLAGGFLFFGNWLKQGASANLLSISAPFTKNQKPVIRSGGLQSPLHFASDFDAVYYDEATAAIGNQNQVSLESAQYNGANEIEPSANDVEDIVVGLDSRVYWTQANDGEIQTHQVERDAGTTTLVSMEYPHFLAYDGDHRMLYVLNSSQENVWSVQRVSTTDSNPQPVMCVDNLTDGGAIQYWNQHVYFSAKSAHGSALFDLSVK
ncbi:MAG: hypothetical protein ABI461_18380 [Polyangiaceae bacterium]